MLFVILLLVVAVAAFNIVAALVMVVKDKRERHRHPAYARGRTAQRAGDVLAAGRVDRAGRHRAGAPLGLLLSANLEALVHGLERLLGTHFLDAKVYFMSDLPAYAERGDVLRICAVAFALCAAGHAVSGLARRADPAGRGAAP